MGHTSSTSSPLAFFAICIEATASMSVRNSMQGSKVVKFELSATEREWFAWVSSMSGSYPVIFRDHLPNLDKPTYLRNPQEITEEDRKRVRERLLSDKEYNGRTLSPLDVLAELYPCGEGARTNEANAIHEAPRRFDEAIEAALDKRFPGSRRVVTIDAAANPAGSERDAGRSGGA